MVDFKEASNHILTFGKYKGKTIDKIAESDEGLKYLDWAKGEDAGNSEDKIMIVVYLDDPTIAKELNEIT